MLAHNDHRYLNVDDVRLFALLGYPLRVKRLLSWWFFYLVHVVLQRLMIDRHQP